MFHTESALNEGVLGVCVLSKLDYFNLTVKIILYLDK